VLDSVYSVEVKVNFRSEVASAAGTGLLTCFSPARLTIYPLQFVLDTVRVALLMLQVDMGKDWFSSSSTNLMELLCDLHGGKHTRQMRFRRDFYDTI
jgi:hypothetical protein